MESITKYRVVLLRNYEDNSMAMNYLEWARTDSQLQEQIAETPNARVELYKNNDDALFIYTNKVDSNNPLESEQSEFVDQYIGQAKREASSMNSEFILVDNTTARHQEKLLFDQMDENFKEYYERVWKALGKTEEEISDLKQVYRCLPSSIEREEDTTIVSKPKVQEVPYYEDVNEVSEDSKDIKTEEDSANISDRELIISLINKVDQMSIEIKELKEILSNPVTRAELEIQEEKIEPVKIEEDEHKDLTDEEINAVKNYAGDVIKEHEVNDEENIPTVVEVDEAIDNTGVADVGGLYQNAVFYPKNPVKKDKIENEPPQLSQTETEVLVADMPEAKDKTPISISKGNESTEKTVIYNSVEKTETLWDSLLAQVGTESELSALIVEKYSELPKQIQDDFLRFNMYDKYKSGKTTTLSKVEAVKRKVKVNRI